MILEDRMIWAIVITLVALWLWDKACSAFWRWWRNRARNVAPRAAMLRRAERQVLTDARMIRDACERRQRR